VISSESEIDSDMTMELLWFWIDSAFR
jgi:hypothetical protein